MQFSALKLKSKYDSDEDDILKEVHIPLLTYAERYDRAVGYFSSNVLSSAAAGLEKFIKSKGKMRLIIGDPLSDTEYEAVMSGLLSPCKTKSLELEQILLDSEDRNLKILTYLVANQQLEIKFAFSHKGMFHKKIGIFYKQFEIVVFSGSANETISGLSKYNTEEISLFFNWRDSFTDYGQTEIDSFNSLWNNTKKRVKVFAIDTEIYERIQKKVNIQKLHKELFPESIEKNHKSVFFKYSFPKSDQDLIITKIETKIPRKPLILNEKPFELHSHQIDAINSWRKADFRGLFKLATGSGKTLTSICALVELYEERQRINESTLAIISVPYIELANQWVQELSLFNIVPVQCYESSHIWSVKLEKKLRRLRSKSLDFVCIVVVNKTLSSEIFQSYLNKIPPRDILFIGDECHHLGSQGYYKALPQARFRIGLSATPFRNDEDEIEGSPFPDIVRQNLLYYFKGIVSEYTLIDAIRDDILTPYRYDIVTVYLTEDEQEQYESLSVKIQNLILKSKSSLLNKDEQSMLTNLCGARSRLLARCSGKLPALIAYLSSNPMLSMELTLIYVGEGNATDVDSPYITQVTNRLHEYGYKVAKFTSQENTSERRSIMDNFKNKHIDALVAMKVLDEGIDIPVCKNAFILASTRNPRQYVQRRGRVLRKSDGKKEALIVDFIVLPMMGTTNNISSNLRKAELDRVKDFKLTASNKSEIDNKIFELGIY